jgi:hypothetical protein
MPVHSRITPRRQRGVQAGMWRSCIANAAVIVGLIGCSQSGGLPPVCSSCHGGPEPFIILETEVQVLVISGPKSPEAELLAILDAVHKSRGSRGLTVGNFIDLAKMPTQRRMYADERASLAFAYGVIDSVFGVRQVKFKAID